MWQVTFLYLAAKFFWRKIFIQLLAEGIYLLRVRERLRQLGHVLFKQIMAILLFGRIVMEMVREISFLLISIQLTLQVVELEIQIVRVVILPLAEETIQE